MVDEQAAREWLLDLADLLERLADLTDTQLDDQIVSGFAAAIGNELIWHWVWKLIGGLLEDEPKVMSAMDDDTALAADQAGVNPATIIAIITAVVELIKLFRK